MARDDDRTQVSIWFKIGILLAVVAGIAVVIALSIVPKAERPQIRQVVTTVTTP